MTRPLLVLLKAFEQNAGKVGIYMLRKKMRTPKLDRDGQQWIFDYIVQETGRVFHWDEPDRQVPESVKSHAQISKHLGRMGQGLSALRPKKKLLVITQQRLNYIIAHHPPLQRPNTQF